MSTHKENVHPVLYSFREINQTMKHLFRTEAEALHLTALQILLLDALEQGGERSVSDLADQLVLSNAAVSGGVDQLVQQGFVTRRRCEHDRRMVFVSLTKRGEEKRSESLGPESRLMKRIDSMLNLPQEELDTLLALHQKMIANLGKEEEGTF
ncbi:MarR family winged helix-turn-helix transcriptional regulator [Paenibacillus sp. J31TS4]|uniref:MarR family winged helix-turn-helix transcriptional regulator n=1 Tax=Paenibacillus sp. J31TS4 TaxID=2807195 RepID=UPI001BCFEF36|nr:MarR family transcriptional regulator [Paenibacillus sp. J31TS4]